MNTQLYPTRIEALKALRQAGFTGTAGSLGMSWWKNYRTKATAALVERPDGTTEVTWSEP